MSGRVIGIAGGIASGKSTVSGLFAELGAVTVDADQLAHAALREPAIRSAVRERWGDGVFAEDGEVDRAALGARVFGAPESLVALEQLIHPRVREMISRALAEHGAAGRTVVLDVPLLLESDHYRSICHCVVYVHSSLQTRQQRAAQRGWAQGELERREAQQMSTDQKARLAHYTINNDGEMQTIRTRVRDIWQKMQEEQRV